MTFEEFKTKKICEAAIRRNGLQIMDVPEEHVSEELDILAVRQNGYALQNMPKSRRTVEACIEAISYAEDLIYQVPRPVLIEAMKALAEKKKNEKGEK